MSESYTQVSDPLKRAQGGSTRNEATSGPGNVYHLTIPSAATHEDSVNKMWSAYMGEAKEYDKRTSDAWKEDAKGVLAFVSPNPPIPCGYHSDKLKRPVRSPQPSEPSSLKATKSYPLTPETRGCSFSDRSHSNSLVLPITRSSNRSPIHHNPLLHPLYGSTPCGY
jgi:hypothetical protein